MSRLKGYGPGELLDRLAILALKRLFGAEAGRDCSAWQQEWGVLLVESRSKRIPTEALLDLAAINAALWHAEDELREWRNQSEGSIKQCDEHACEEIAGIAFRIQALNDARAALVDKINREAGEGGGSDKVTQVQAEVGA